MRHHLTLTLFLLAVVIALVLLTACGGAGPLSPATPTATPQPTLTPTLAATPAPTATLPDPPSHIGRPGGG